MAAADNKSSKSNKEKKDVVGPGPPERHVEASSDLTPPVNRTFHDATPPRLRFDWVWVQKRTMVWVKMTSSLRLRDLNRHGNNNTVRE